MLKWDRRVFKSLNHFFDKHMRTQNKIFLRGAILVTTLLSSCVVSNKILVTPLTTIIPLPTTTPTSIPIPSPTLITTLTPIPTLSSENAFQTFVNLIEKDSECYLPCWLRVTPGRTHFGDARNMFSQFSAIAITEFSPRWAYIKMIYPSYYMTTLVYPAKDGLADHILVDTSIDRDANGKVLYNDALFRKMWQRYFLPELFTIHGAPEKLFLDTTLITADTSTRYFYVLWVVYPQQGFLIRYQGDNSKIGGKIRICPLQSRITVISWNPETSTYEKYIKDDMAMGTSLGPQPLESVTDFDIESFYETFRSGQLTTCFETSMSIWPH